MTDQEINEAVARGIEMLVAIAPAMDKVLARKFLECFLEDYERQQAK